MRRRVGSTPTSFRHGILRGCGIILAAALLSTGTKAGPAPLPAELLDLIAQVRFAAQQRDHAALRARMADEFLWSFGGDALAGQAIDAWKADPTALRRLAAATRARCAEIASKPEPIVQCPAAAGTGDRAGFKRVGGAWKFVYFVAGD